MDTGHGLVKYDYGEYPILKCRSFPLPFSEEQLEVLKRIQVFLKIDGYATFLINGNSGSGKTSLSENVVKYSGATVIAPTNAALQRLRDKITNYPKDMFMTIHSLLYGEPDEHGEFRPSQKATSFHVTYVVDESSMIDKKVLNDLLRHAVQYKCKLIFLGDDFQLEPVGEDPLLFANKNEQYFKKDHVFKITQVQRSIGDILKVATHLRTKGNSEILNIHSEEFQIVNTIQEEIQKALQSKENHIVLVSTNKTRIRINNWARKKVYGDDIALANVICSGEKVVSVGNNLFVNCELYDIIDPVIIDDMGEVEINVGAKMNPKMEKYHFYVIEHKVSGYENRIFTTLLIPDLNLPSLHGNQLLLNKPFQTTQFRMIDEFSGAYRWRKAVNIATYGYAISCNKSQGNEWDNVYIYVDWLFDGPVRNKWLYTAITRGKKKTVINKSNFINIVPYNGNSSTENNSLREQ